MWLNSDRVDPGGGPSHNTSIVNTGPAGGPLNLVIFLNHKPFMPKQQRRQRNNNQRRRRRNQQRSRQNGRQSSAIVPSAGPALMPCTRHYISALTNPFDLHANPCVPDMHAIPTKKLRMVSRGTFQIGSQGVGCWSKS